MPRYIGPSDNFEFPAGSGKFYQPGDNIPISKELEEHHAVWGGHQFDGAEFDAPAAPMPPHDDPKPFVDGREVDPKDPKGKK